MTEHEHELPLRDPRSLMHEADYWTALLEDLRELNQLVPAAADAAAEVPVAMLELLLSADPTPAREKATAAARVALGELEKMGAPIDRMIELATGRITAMRREGGLEG